MAGRSKSPGKRANRKLLKDALRATEANAVDQGPVDPIDAIQHVLDRTYTWLVYASGRVEKLDEKRLWRNAPGVGRIPHEWIRLEQDFRREVGYLAARMLDLDIEDRKAHAAEILASVLTPVFEGIFKDLRLSGKQQARAKQVVANHLRLLEGPTVRDVSKEPKKVRSVSEAD